MTKFKSANIKESISNAIHGLKLALCSQKNFVLELWISLFVIILALVLRFSLSDFCIVLVMITFVLVCELVNSVVEFTLDAVYKNNYSKLVEMAKDLSAGMVLFSAFMSIVVGLLLFGNYTLKFTVKYYNNYKFQHSLIDYDNNDLSFEEIILKKSI